MRSRNFIYGYQWQCGSCGETYYAERSGGHCQRPPEPRYRSALPVNPAPVPEPEYDSLPDDGNTPAARAYKAAVRRKN